METDRERRERETVRLAEISNHASLYMGHRQWKIRWCCEMELLSFNPSNVPGDTHQITTEPSVHSHTDRGERTQPDPHCPHCGSPFSSAPLPLSPRLCSMLGGGVKEEGRQWRCGWEHTQCPVPHCFQMKCHSLCLPCVGAASLVSSALPQIFLSLPHTALHSHAESACTVWERLSRVWRLCWTFFSLSCTGFQHCWWGCCGEVRVLLRSASLALPITAAQMCVPPCVAVNYLIN